MITAQIAKQIRSWQAYCLLAPVGYILLSIWLHSQHWASWPAICVVGMVIVIMSCVAWWHWSMNTILTLMLAVDHSNAHWARLDARLADIQSRLE